jgi:hypothetical protein
LLLDFRFLCSSLRFIDCLQFPPRDAHDRRGLQSLLTRDSSVELAKHRGVVVVWKRLLLDSRFLCSSLRLIDCLRFPLRGDARNRRDFGLYSPEIRPSTKVACKELCGVINFLKEFLLDLRFLGSAVWG